MDRKEAREIEHGINTTRSQTASARRAAADLAAASAKPAPASFPPEVEHGNREYKLELASCSHDRITRLISQLKWRLAEGDGEAVYMLGVEDDGTALGISGSELGISLRKVREMGAAVDAEIVSVIKRDGLTGFTAEVTLRRKRAAAAAAAEARVLCVGASGVGKTSLVGVLKTDDADDGRGLARLHVLKHQHELDHGLTSDVSCHTLRYDADGVPLIDSDSDQDVPAGIFTDCDERAEEGSVNVRDMVTLVDTAGHPRFFKSVVYGVTAMAPDAALLVVDKHTLAAIARRSDGAPGSCSDDDAVSPRGDAEAHRVRMTLDMLHVLRILKLPFSLVVTKADEDEDEDEDEERADEIRTRAAALLACAPAVPAEYCDGGAPAASAAAEPSEVLVVSSTSKRGIPALRSHLCALSRRLARSEARLAAREATPRFFVREAFDILGFDGAILGGVLERGTIALNDALRLGPGPAGGSFDVRVRSIRTAYGLDVESLEAGAAATIGVCLEPSSTCSASAVHANPDAQDVFKRVVRRGALLAVQQEQEHEENDDIRAVHAVELQVLACLDVALGSLALKLGRGKKHQFTLRCRTVKQRVTCEQTEDEGALRAVFVERPECVPFDVPVVLQRGTHVIFCRRTA